jgi:hypothetical protein
MTILKRAVSRLRSWRIERFTAGALQWTALDQGRGGPATSPLTFDHRAFCEAAILPCSWAHLAPAGFGLGRCLVRDGSQTIS